MVMINRERSIIFYYRKERVHSQTKNNCQETSQGQEGQGGRNCQGRERKSSLLGLFFQWRGEEGRGRRKEEKQCITRSEEKGTDEEGKAAEGDWKDERDSEINLQDMLLLYFTYGLDRSVCLVRSTSYWNTHSFLCSPWKVYQNVYPEVLECMPWKELLWRPISNSGIRTTLRRLPMMMTFPTRMVYGRCGRLESRWRTLEWFRGFRHWSSRRSGWGTSCRWKTREEGRKTAGLLMGVGKSQTNRVFRSCLQEEEGQEKGGTAEGRRSSNRCTSSSPQTEYALLFYISY